MATPISIVDGEYRINGGTWTNSTGAISNGDTLQVRRNSSPSYSTQVGTLVTVGAYTTDFLITTKAGTFVIIRTADFQKNNCTGQDTGSFVTYSKEYFSNISEADAQLQADADVSNFIAQGQLKANEEGQCFPPLPSDAVGIVVVDLYQSIDVCAFVDTPGVVPYQMPVFAGNNFLPNDGTPPANCWALSSDAINTGGIRRRFEFNIARLLNTYPAIPSYTFRVRGRGVGSGFMNGAYSLKGADAGNMIMTGSPGAYIPSVVSASDLGVLGYSGKPFVGGADGNIGLAFGADILVLTYNVASKQLTLL